MAPPRPASGHAPHPPLTEYYAGSGERERWVRALFDRTASDYDRVEHLVGFGSGPWYRKRALRAAGLTAGMDLLDVGAGTGLVSKAALSIVGSSGSVTAVDPSPGMLAAANFPGTVRVMEGFAERLPAENARFDFLSMGFALRHVGDLAAAFAEFHRVLRPGGRLCVLEITRPRGALATRLLRAYMRGVVPSLAALVGRHAESRTLMRYYWDTIEACVPPETVLRALDQAGFVGATRTVTLGIFSEYHGRRADA